MKTKSKARRLLQKLKKVLKLKLVKVSLITLIVLLLSALVVNYVLSMRQKTQDPFEFIAENPFLVLQINNSRDFVNAVKRDTFIYEYSSILNVRGLIEQLNYTDSVLRTNKTINNIWGKSGFIVSTHFMGARQFESLIIFKLPHPKYSSKIMSFFNDNFQNIILEDEIFSNILINKYSNQNFSFYISIKNGVVLVSKSKQLIKNSILHSKKNTSILSDSTFNKIYATAGKNALANFFINFQFSYRFFVDLIDGEALKALDVLNNFATWSGFDVHLRENRLILTGYTSTEQQDLSFLHQFSECTPQKPNIINILPSNTSAFLWLGFDNYIEFREKQKIRLNALQKFTDFNNNLSNLKNRTKIQDIDDLIFPYIGNEKAIFWTANKNIDGSQETYAVLSTKNTPTLIKNLKDISLSIRANNRLNVEPFIYRNFEINFIAADYMLYDLFGPMFSSIHKIYYIFNQNNLVVASSQKAIENYIDAIIAGRTLDKQADFIEFSKTMSNETNFYFYSSPRQLKNLINKFIVEEQAKQMDTTLYNIDKIGSFAFQFTSVSNMFHSTVSLLRVDKNLEEETSEGWELKFEAPISSGPWFVEVADQLSKNIVIFDAFNYMYFITEKGEVLWKTPLLEKPISRVFTVDAFKNNKKQYLFSTSNYIYLVDRNGNNVAPFPFKLPRQAAAGIQVLDYDNSRDYRIIFPGIDNILYNFDLKPEQVKGWLKPKTSENITSEVKHLRLLGSDVLILRDIKNNLHFFNRRGEKLFQTENFSINQFSDIYTAADYCKCFITSNNEGQLSMINAKGEINLKTIHELTAGHTFLHEDFDNNGSKDFIYVDRGKIFVFDTEYNLIYNVDISNNIGRGALFVQNSPYGALILTFSSDGRIMFIANKDGRILPNSTFTANNHADFVFNNKTNKLLIISALDNTLFLNIID